LDAVQARVGLRAARRHAGLVWAGLGSQVGLPLWPPFGRAVGHC
jgi:hypothetical protein